MRTNFPPKNEKDFISFILKSREMRYDTRAVDVRIKYTMEYGYIYVWRYRFAKTRSFLGFPLKDEWKPIWRWTMYCGREGKKEGYDPTDKASWYPVLIYGSSGLEEAEKTIESITTFKDLWVHFGLEENYRKAEEDGCKFFRNRKAKEDILKKYEV